MPAADVEKGETQPLLGQESPRDKIMAEIKSEPAGGYAGNPMFPVVFQLSLRGAVFSLLLATMVWVPIEGLNRYKPYTPLAVCILIFTLNPVFGQVVDNAGAGIYGTFIACLNIFLLRGFFPDGVDPGDGHFSAASIVGWANLMIFNMLFLSTECRMGCRMFAMACNTGFMLAFLNPADQSVYSKNFKINVNGVAVSAFVGTAIGALLAIVAMLIPYPWRFAKTTMQDNARSASLDVCRLYVSAVDYFKGAKPSIVIEQQGSNCVALKAKLGGLGGTIGAAWNEGFDIGTAGTVRKLMEEHAGLLGEVFDILHSMQIALETEDFGESHIACMNAIGEVSMDVAQKTSILLMKVTASAGDGDISAEENKDLLADVVGVMAAVKLLATKFDGARQAYKPISKELLSESFFVFALSGYARKVCAYVEMLCNKPPQGDSFGTVLINAIKGTFTPPGKYHGRFTFRYWVALMLCFLYGVTIDNYGGACAITAVFLINTRVGPDPMATINTLLAVVMGAVVGAMIYGYSCMTGYGFIVLPVMYFLYLWVTMFIGFGGSSFALMGIFMAALAPFHMQKQCPGDEVSATAGATAIWIGIKGFISSMVIVSFCELVSVPGEQAKLAVDSWEDAMKQIAEGFHNLWETKGPGESLKPVGGSLGDAAMYNSGAVLEPRFWRCKWKSSYFMELVGLASKLRLDILMIRAALEGSDGDIGETTDALKQVGASFEKMKKDLNTTLEDARQVGVALLRHETGRFTGLEELETTEGIDELDDFDKTVIDANGVIKKKALPDSMEEDLPCQLSIVFILLDYTVKHMAAIIKATVRDQ